MAYKVTAPLVLVKVPGVGDDYRVDYHYAGSVIPALTDEQRERFLDEGMVEEVSDSEAPVEVGGPKKPNKTSPLAEWQQYAVSQGADLADAQGATRQELIELYGG